MWSCGPYRGAGTGVGDGDVDMNRVLEVGLLTVPRPVRQSGITYVALRAPRYARRGARGAAPGAGRARAGGGARAAGGEAEGSRGTRGKPRKPPGEECELRVCK